MISHADVLKIDRAISGKLVELAIAKGYSLTVRTNDDDAHNVIKSRDPKVILDELHSVDDERLYVHDANGKRLGWIYFVFGESGWDVICDHTTGRAITELVDTGPIKAISDGICENPENWSAILAQNGAAVG